VSLASGALGFSYHDNGVEFQMLLSRNQVVPFTGKYLVQTHSVTNGQDPQGQYVLVSLDM
jgi:hypothetical protein